MRPASSTAMLRASVNIPGPIPSLPNFKTSVAKLLLVLPPAGSERFPFDGAADWLEGFNIRTSGDRAPTIARTPITTPNTGINNTSHSHFREPTLMEGLHRLT